MTAPPVRPAGETAQAGLHSAWADGRRLVVKRLPLRPGRDPGVLGAILTAAGRAGVAPLPLPDGNGNSVTVTGDGISYTYAWIPGETPATAELRSLGPATVARLHAALAPLSFQTWRNHIDHTVAANGLLDFSLLPASLRDTGERVEAVCTGIAARRPQQIIHADLHPGNFLHRWDDGGGLVVLDLDSSTWSLREEDVGVAALRCCGTDPKTFAAFVTAYNATADTTVAATACAWCAARHAVRRIAYIAHARAAGDTAWASDAPRQERHLANALTVAAALDEIHDSIIKPDL